MPEIIAHRGESHLAPENTLAAVNLAWENAADAVECDIHLSKDGEIVVIHDDNTMRTAGRDAPVSEQTLAELRALDAGKWKGERWSGEKIPTLAEILATVPDGKSLFVEIKCGPEVIPKIGETLRESSKSPRQVVPIGFSLSTMEAAKRAFPQLDVYWLCGFSKCEKTGAWAPTVGELVDNAGRAGVDGLNLQFHEAIDSAFVRGIKAANLKLYVWTIDSPSDARRMAAISVDGVSTNRAGWLRGRIADRG